MRLPFLVLPPVCVLLGTATAVWTGYSIHYFYLILAFIGAVSAHISVNALNEYYDFKSGLDLKTEPTPFSGGSKSLPQNPQKANVALFTGLVTFFIPFFIGIYFWSVWGFWIAPLGILGLILVFTYTSWLTKNPVLCLLAPGIGFGPLMVMGTDFVLTGSFSWTAFIASMVPFFLVSNLLLLNQFPDVEADIKVGRKHYPILIGKKRSIWIYGLFLVGTYLTLIVGYLTNTLPLSSFLGLITIILAIPTLKGVIKNFESIPQLIPFMGKNVVIIIVTPVLISIGMFLSL
jgi:1,4-dihydroxy-2-naphthoate octaprenyltransferase